jgi:protease IV
MKARGCALSGRLVLELVRSVALLLALTAAAGLAQADDGATAVAEPPPAAEGKPATETAPAAEAPPAAAKPADAKTDAKPADEKPVEAKTTEKPSDAEATRAEKRKEAEAKAKAEAAKLQVQLITLGGTYEDIVGANEFDPTSLVIGGSPGKRRNFYKLCELLEETAKNPKIHAVVIDLSDADLTMNLAQLDELLRRLGALRKSGKKVGAWLESAESAHLAVAAGCDHVAMADLGGIDMPSKTMQSYFYRDAMDLLGLKASVVRAGNFKGAVEPYVNSAMSEHLRQHYLDMLTSMNDAQVSMIARGRGLTTEKVRELQKQRLFLPAEALAAGLVDELAPFGTMKATLNRWVGGETSWVEAAAKPKKEMSFFELMGKVMSGGGPDKAAKVTETSIAVMHLSGAIVDGKKESPGSIVSGPTVKAIQEIGRDDKIKGVVVRINSPGGSATASEAIRQALAELSKKKPTVVSMGEMAASGGYWVACLGVPVYAERGTLTGSIGVFSMKISFGTLLKRVGLHMENIALDEAASAFAPDRGWNEDDQAKLQKTIDDVYGRFLKLVSDSRGIPIEKLQDLAGGRVWSGSQAKAAGLVDEIGGLDDCLAAVAKKAGIEKYEIVHRPNVSAGLDLSVLFGDPDASSRLSALGVSREAITLLGKAGLRTGVIDLFLREVLSGASARPTIWALAPDDLSIR